MPRTLRLVLAALLFSAIFANAACEDDPNDLDFTKDAGDHGDHGDHDDAG